MGRPALRLALAVPFLCTDLQANLAMIATLAHEAAEQGAQLVLFPETALTGFVHTGNPEPDRRLAVPVPGIVTDEIAALARKCGLHLGIGLLERSGDVLYDAALLFAPNGQIILHYRRISSEWHSRHSDPAVYAQGSEIAVAQTPFGTCCFLICGDITHDALLDRVHDSAPDWLLFPLARGYDEDVRDEQQWHTEEVAIYGQHVARAGAATLLVNYIGEMDQYYGGAVVFDADGSVLASRPLHEPGLLVVDLPARP